jgi:ubiquitin-like 1-activating enzyme E1 A
MVPAITFADRIAQTHTAEVCHAQGIAFFAGDVFGFLGYFFSDLGAHDFIE